MSKKHETADYISEQLSEGWWNYRFVQITNTWTCNKKEQSETYYELHEVYYDGKGRVICWSENPMSIYYDDYKDHKTVMKQIKKAYKKPVMKLINKDTDDETLVPLGKTMKQLYPRKRWFHHDK